MSSDTDGVLSAIDGALADWTSPDAMRWTPEAPPEDRTSPPVRTIRDLLDLRSISAPPTPHVWPQSFRGQHLHFMFTDEALGPFNDAMARATQRIADLTPPLREAGKAIGRVHERLVEAGMIPAEPPTDPRGRALWARRNRNTGPARDPFTHRGIR